MKGFTEDQKEKMFNKLRWNAEFKFEMPPTDKKPRRKYPTNYTPPKRKNRKKR